MAAPWTPVNPSDARRTDLPYPMEAFRHRYVTPFGGFSTDLYPGEIGVREDALAANTDLAPFQDHVLVSSDLGGQRFPLFTREMFRIVALNEETPDALVRSPNGEAVFSPFEDPTAPRATLQGLLKRGAPVFLNAAARRLAGGNDATQDLIRRMLERQRRG